MTEQGEGKDGRFGIYGGQYVAETLMPALVELEEAFQKYWADPGFQNEYRVLLRDYVGRPSPLYHARRLSRELGGAQIFLKREDLNHTGAHKINNTLGQAMLARHMGKRRLIAETGAGMHGVATATVAALFGQSCDVFMGTEDMRRQAPNVDRMRMLGARVIPVDSGTGTLKDAMNEAIRNWVATVEDTFYVIGTVAGPHPYPNMVKSFQTVIGIEAKQQCMDRMGRLPDEIIACIGGGSNAMGIFAPFIEDSHIRLIGVEAAGIGLDSGLHAASMLGGEVGVLHGNKTYLLQDDDGQVHVTHSISAGLDYPGVGPEHAWMFDEGRLEVCGVEDKQALEAFHQLCRLEGIIPALESAHAVAAAMDRAPRYDAETMLLVNLSGRGDKDMQSVLETMKEEHGNG